MHADAVGAADRAGAGGGPAFGADFAGKQALACAAAGAAVAGVEAGADTTQALDDLHRAVPELRVVVRVGVHLSAVGDDRRFQRLAVGNLRGHRVEELRRRDVGVQPLLAGAPSVLLLEQADRRRAGAVGVGDPAGFPVAVVDVPEAGFTHRSHDADGLIPRVQAEVFARLHDICGVHKLLVAVAGNLRLGDGCGVDRDARSAVAGARAALVLAHEEEPEQGADDEERHRRDRVGGAALGRCHQFTPSGRMKRPASQGESASARLSTTP